MRSDTLERTLESRKCLDLCDGWKQLYYHLLEARREIFGATTAIKEGITNNFPPYNVNTGIQTQGNCPLGRRNHK